MICDSTFYGILYQRGASGFPCEISKKDSVSLGEKLFSLEEEGTDEIVKKHGKQSVSDDAKAAGKKSAKELPKTETESRIIVKPDGSKVLVITTRCGQSVRVKSLKLTDPTDMENEGKKEGVEQSGLQEKTENIGNGNIKMSEGESAVKSAAAGTVQTILSFDQK